jgi:hypothetical protein
VNDRDSAGELWTPIVLGDELTVEAHLPAGARPFAAVEIARVNHGFRFFGEPRRGAVDKQGACNIDVVCPEGDPWRDQIRSVGWYTLAGIETCTGTLMNNTSQDLSPYLLTANHCDVNSALARTMVVYWNYESPNCGDLSGGSLSDTTRRATWLADWEQSDTTLVRLDEQPDSAYNVYYSGWDATGVAPQGSVGIHHPNTDEKAISFNDDPLYDFDIQGTHWEVGEWEQGTTEPGSSGSCLFDPASKLCVGTLHGGLASCDFTQGYDYYGKLSVAFAGGGGPTNSLKPWLDPGNTGALTQSGMNPGGSSQECTPDSDTFCFANGRFKVEVTWRDFQGSTGVGSVVPGSTDNSGLFWFFDAANWEMLVKVLDGCQVNGNYWVFSAAATDVEYTLTVTDTDNGTVRTYLNPLGTAAPATTDTAAFATCP